MLFLLITLIITVIASVVILNKYIDFACSVMSKKNKLDHSEESKVIYWCHPNGYNSSRKKDIVIDIPFTEVKVVKNDRSEHNYNKHNVLLPNKEK
jgi:hypothetical protein